ncbi:MAG: hypothetical protein J6N21_04715 [Butyrivibrio sp.]|nr:hypothetical protein [Butyrivibrio sp.]
MLKTNYDGMMKVPVKEAYFGGSKNLQKGVKALEKITSVLRSSSEVEMVSLNFTESPENAELQECFKKEFGFNKMIIVWSNDVLPNAYTIPGGILLEPNPDPGIIGMERDQRDRYYDKQHRYTCVIVIMMNLVRTCQLNARETMGILLHEVGHNFDNTAMTFGLKFVNGINSFFIDNIFTAAYRHIVVPVDSFFQNNLPWVKKLTDIINVINWHLDVLPVSLAYIVSIATNPERLYGFIFGLLRQPGEEFSDDFAATYGFGPDLTSANSKLGDPTKLNGTCKKAIYSCPVFRTLYDLMEAPVRTLIQFFDEHPYDENRIGNIERKLEKDYNSPQVPKALKPEIMAQIKQLRKIQKAHQDRTEEQQLLFTRFRQEINAKIKGNKTE